MNYRPVIISVAVVLAVAGCKKHTPDSTTTSAATSDMVAAPATPMTQPAPPTPAAKDTAAAGDLHNLDPTRNASAAQATKPSKP